MRDVSSIRSDKKAQGATALTAGGLRALLSAVQVNEFCQSRDLADPIVVSMATGMRISELLALRWEDYDAGAGTLTVAGKVVRSKGQGLRRFPEAKTEAGSEPTRSEVRHRGAQRPPVAPIRRRTADHLRLDGGLAARPEQLAKQWRTARQELAVPEVTTHSFRKTVATLIDEEGMSARVGADQLGHSNVSMTQNRYMARGRVHNEVAALLDRTVSE